MLAGDRLSGKEEEEEGGEEEEENADILNEEEPLVSSQLSSAGYSGL